MAVDEETCAEARSVGGSIELDLEDRLYLEAHNDPERIANKFSKGPQRLGFWSIVCIIINRMMGSGIFKTPTTLLKGTQSVGVSLMFWFCGALATIAGAMVFIEFGLTTPRYLIDGRKEAVPRNGGELVYLQYLFKKPRYLVTCVYGLLFIVVGNMAGNSIAFGDYILRAAGHENPSRAAVRGIALGVITFTCIFHGTWRKGGIWLNNFFAVLKVATLCFIVVVGFCALGGVFGDKANKAATNYATDKSFSNTSDSSYGYAEGFLSVIFAYTGFTQSNYVLSEVDQPRKKFRKGVLSAVSLMCVLYMLVNVAYFIVVDKDDPRLGASDVSTLFFKNTFGGGAAPRVLNAFMAISGLGNIIVMTFTAARVKQEIAKEGILPWPKFFGQSSNVFGRTSNRLLGRPVKDAASIEATPVGALALHWAFSVLLILATWGQSTENAYSVLTLLYSYCIGSLLSTVLGLGMLYLRLFTPRRRRSSSSPEDDKDQFSMHSHSSRRRGGWRAKSPFNHYVSTACAFVFFIANLYPLIGNWIPPSTISENPPRSSLHDLVPDYPWYLVPAVGWALVGCGVLYWGAFAFLVPQIGYRKGKEFVVEREPIFHIEHGYHVQLHEIVSFHWVVKGVTGGSESGSEEAYDSDGR
ncbi:high-affinity methionine permease [Diplodia corticola]|uniref:High-affinity methionine permease n=1 Tax=Diplodia corticola TaxID=236234 RepID=A0A1J9RA65_9PEZI|nr:high-affinity methionine permease [Diplodia corticola]OJD37432.1 high-affinity methionine permease [Diplodia corticola]